MATRTLGIIMNGVTGRMGLNQHLVRSILAIQKEGGVTLPNGDRVMPDPILVGRNAERIAALILESGLEESAVHPCSGACREAIELYFSTPPERWRAPLTR